MSKLSDYSKFDHIDSDSDDGGDATSNDNDKSASAVATGVHKKSSSSSSPQSTTATKLPQQAQQPMHVGGTTKKGKDGRYVFEMNGRKIYEWEQSLEEVNLYIEAPPNVAAQQIICNIQTNRLQLGLRNHDRFFIDERTYSKVKSADSSWYLDDGIIHIILAKVFRGETWEGVLMGHELEDQTGGNERSSLGNRRGGGEAVDPFIKQQMQQDLMKERFQEENPGFDFRDATFNGEAPDPRTFMGGVRYD